MLPLQLAVDIEAEEAIREYDRGDEDAQPHATLSATLFAHGAAPHRTGAAGKTAVDWARDRNHQEALRLFGAALDP
jgi:hypothetical protein